MRNVNVALVYNNTRENKLPFRLDYIPEGKLCTRKYPCTRLTHPGLSRSEGEKMDDGLVINIATDAPVLAKHISSKKSGRWTDR